MNDSGDNRSAYARAMEMVTRLTAIGLEMALPGLGGFGLDRWLGTSPALLIVGVLLGFVLGMYELLRLARTNDSRRP